MFELRDIVAGYGETTVLRGVDLRVPDGSVVALLGPNGAGKTTMLRVASGLLRPDSGRLLLDGDDVTDAGPYRLARRGVEVEMPRRRSTVYALDVITYTGDADRIDAVTLDLRVGSGTYVRAIAHALGGHCRTLRRTEVGPFTVAEAVAPEAFEAGRLLAEADVLARVRARP